MPKNPLSVIETLHVPKKKHNHLFKESAKINELFWCTYTVM